MTFKIFISLAYICPSSRIIEYIPSTVQIHPFGPKLHCYSFLSLPEKMYKTLMKYILKRIKNTYNNW